MRKRDEVSELKIALALAVRATAMTTAILDLDIPLDCLPPEARRRLRQARRLWSNAATILSAHTGRPADDYLGQPVEDLEETL